jgi:hypothetical protein
MCIYGIFRDDLRFYCFQIREITKSKQDTSNNKHATTQKSTTYSSIQWDGHNFTHVLSKKLMLLYHYTNQKDKDFSLDRRMLEGLGIDPKNIY